MRRWPKLTSEQLRVSLQNLQRLGLLAPNITEMEVLKYTTFEDWEKSFDENNIAVEFKKVVKNLVLELTNLTGNPMNDFSISNTKAAQIALIDEYGLTRIGFDLYSATSRKDLASKSTPNKKSSRRTKKTDSLSGKSTNR